MYFFKTMERDLEMQRVDRINHQSLDFAFVANYDGAMTTHHNTFLSLDGDTFSLSHPHPSLESY